MNTLQLSIIALTLTASTSLHADEFIRQKQLASGLIWDQHVKAPEGERWASLPVGKGGSLFSLHTKGNGTDTNLYQVDATTAGSKFPTVEVTIHSEDPHFQTRTRADKPFSITIKTQGNSSPLNLHHHGTSYDRKIHTIGEESTQRNFGWTELDAKKTHQASFFTQLPSADPTKTEGEETVTAYSQDPDTKKWLPLGSADIQVWPVASAKITGIKTNGTITDSNASQLVSLDCRDLYPDSITYAQIYRTKEKLGTLGRILPQSVVKFDTQVPQNQKIPLGNILQTLEDGHYTLEVLTITPFNQRKPERLSHVSFIVDRGLHNPGLVSAGNLGGK